ncbi:MULTISPECIES: aminotransferase [unclassified Minwuia]|jgi:N-succinyldiaminopimelate aminotransferase|uniref:aminotransferase n=1 Tax=unclassified Minwuia TaxID=2618799 RepID=UPI0024786B12|nr:MULTISPECIES: aminotransferase [unclassified Minwuia]
MKDGNGILAEYGVTVFEVMSRLAIEHGSINLGQGFPDDNGPDDVRAVAAAALEDQPNQYPPMLGVPDLRQAVAAHGKRFYGLDVDWQTETMVTSGATESLAACFLALIEPGDEVVCFEPLYDCYLPMIRRAGGIPKLVRLDPPDWTLPEDRLRAAFGPKTKFILLNNPLNPAAKAFSRAELQIIADLVLEHDTYAVCDEVYEHILFDGLQHTPLISLDGMRDRCIKIGSAGKTFSLTGWKVGYMTACPALLQRVAKAHQFLTFTTAPNLQRAVAFGLAKDDSYFTGLTADMQAKRDRIRDGLTAIGFEPALCQGTYFLNADIRSVGFEGSDVDFCREITLNAGVTTVPVSAFYASEGARTNFVRFCLSKQDSLLDAAVAKLGDWVGRG